MGRNLGVDDAQGGELRRAVPELRPIEDLAPAGSAAQLEGDQFRDLFDDLGEWTGAVDVLEDAAAPLFDEPQRGDLPAHSVLDGPFSDAHGEDESEQQSNEEDEVANGKQGWPGDDHNIVKGAHEDIERHIADVWIDRKSTRLNSSHLGISY